MSFGRFLPAVWFATMLGGSSAPARASTDHPTPPVEQGQAGKTTKAWPTGKPRYGFEYDGKYGEAWELKETAWISYPSSGYRRIGATEQWAR